MGTVVRETRIFLTCRHAWSCPGCPSLLYWLNLCNIHPLRSLKLQSGGLVSGCQAAARNTVQMPRKSCEGRGPKEVCCPSQRALAYTKAPTTLSRAFARKLFHDRAQAHHPATSRPLLRMVCSRVR